MHSRQQDRQSRALSTGPPQIGLAAVYIGRPRPLGRHRGHLVDSGIAKRPVTQPTLRLDRLNLEGDGQADLLVHGGPDKAVYAYPCEHLAVWTEELGGEDLGPAAFGENLSTLGATEDDVCIGDRWRWGDATLEVCQPRSPCYKLALHRRRVDIASRLRTSGRTGWYLRVLEPGTVPTAGPITVVTRHPMGATVRAMHEASRPGVASPKVLEALLCVEPLAEEWKATLAHRRWG